MKKLAAPIVFSMLSMLLEMVHAQSPSDFYLVNHTDETITKVYLACHGQDGDWIETPLRSGGSIDPGDAQYVAMDPDDPCYTADLRVDYEDNTYAEYQDGINLHKTHVITISHRGDTTYFSFH